VEKYVDCLCLEQSLIAAEVSGVSREIFRRAKLRRIDEDRDHDSVCSHSGVTHQA
jgi:hypothetical protein